MSSKICDIVETIFSRCKSRNVEMFSIAVPLFDISGRPGTFDVLSCILGNKSEKVILLPLNSLDCLLCMDSFSSFT